MGRRRSVRKIQTEHLQGKGSYVVLSQIKVGEITEARKRARDPDVDAFEQGLDMLRDHILDWNWVDDHDEPLPLPSQDPDVVYELTNDESSFLVNTLQGTAEAKN